MTQKYKYIYSLLIINKLMGENIFYGTNICLFIDIEMRIFIIDLSNDQLIHCLIVFINPNFFQITIY